MNFPERLVGGYRAFLAGQFPAEQKRFTELAEAGQQPETMVIGCCDSRVPPEVIFDARPGELFVVRNVANLVPPYLPTGSAHGVSAALEFAVLALKVKHIVVLGHARCGGIRAYVAKDPPLSPGDFVGEWMSLIAPAAERIEGRLDPSLPEYLTQLEQASTVRALDNLMTFPCIHTLVERGRLTLHAAYFDVATGELWVHESNTGTFTLV